MMWPSVFEVLSYRRDVYKLVCEVIARAPDEAIANITMDSPYWALPMAMEHERIHIETSRCVAWGKTYNTSMDTNCSGPLLVSHG